MTERIRRSRPAEPEPVGRVSRSRPAPVEERVKRVREAPVPLEDVKIRWVDYKGHKCLYIGSVYFGQAGAATASPHHKSKYVGNVQIPGTVGPVSYGDNLMVVMRDVKNKAMEWLDRLCGDPPTYNDERTTVKRRK